MNLSEHTLEKCIDFIKKEGYNIKNYVHGKKKEKNYTLLYICNNIDINFAMKYNQYYECIMGKFNSISNLEIQLNIWDHAYSPLAIGIFYKNTNKTIKYNINNFNTHLDKGNKLTDEYKSKNNICYQCEKNNFIMSCDICLKYKVCTKCINFIYCNCGCKLKGCPKCLEKKFTKCCNNYYYKKHTKDYCDTCIYKKLIELSKLELTDISQGYLMELIAQQIDISEDENIVKELEAIYDPKLKIYSMYNYKDSEVNKTDLYIFTGYILDNELSENDLQVKKLVLREYIKYYKEHHTILSLEEIKKYI